MDRLTVVVDQIDRALAEISSHYQRFGREMVGSEARTLHEEKLRLLAARQVLTGTPDDVAQPLRRRVEDAESAAGRARMSAVLHRGGRPPNSA